MRYLEFNELIIGESYICIPYGDSSLKMVLKYLGEGKFVSEKNEEFSVYGDIRYVISKVQDAT